MSVQANLVTGPLVSPKIAVQGHEVDPLTAFKRIFNGDKEIAPARFTDRFTRWGGGEKNTEELLQGRMRYAAHRIAGGNPLQAERAIHEYAKQLLKCSLVEWAEKAMIFSEKLLFGELTEPIFDLSDPKLREMVFARLIAAGLAVKTDTSMLPPEWGLGKRWVLIKRSLDLGQFEEVSRKFLGSNYLQRKIDPSRPDVETLVKPPVPYGRNEMEIKKYHDKWISALDTLEEAGIPVARPDYEVSYNVSVRSWRPGARKKNLGFSQVGLNADQIDEANEKFKDVVARGRRVGVWKDLADWQAARNLVYQLDVEEPQWIAIEP